jgi:membrane protein
MQGTAMTEAEAAGTVGRPGLWNGWRAFLRSLIDALREVNLNGLAAQVSYSLIFAMPSILLIIALVAHAVDERTGFAITEEVRTFIVEALPLGIQPVVTGLVNDAVTRAREGPTTLSAVIAILVALVAAGNGFGELATAFDRAAEIEDDRPAWAKRFIFTASAVLIAMLLLVVFTLYVWGGGLIEFISAYFGQQSSGAGVWDALQGPVILVLVFLGATLLYMTSSGCYCFRETAPGAVVATIIWLLVVKGFQFYLQFANPGSAYGAASSVLVFLVFLYLSSMGLIIGAMSAAVIVRQSRQQIRAVGHEAGICPAQERGDD